MITKNIYKVPLVESIICFRCDATFAVDTRCEGQRDESLRVEL